MCVAVVGQFCFVLFLMVLAFVLQADLSVHEHISPLVSFAASNHWQGGGGWVSSARQETDFIFCFVLMGHTALCLWLNAWVFRFVCFVFFSWQYVTLLSVCLSDWRKMWGSNVLVMFSVKLGNLMIYFAKTSLDEYLICPLHFASVCLM